MKFYLHYTTDLKTLARNRAIYLFNEGDHLSLQSKRGWHIFEYRELTSLNVFARIHFHIKDGHASSPLKAPFGSVEIFRKLNEAQLTDFLEQVQRQLIILRVKKVTIRNSPDLYDRQTSSLLQSILKKLGFEYTEEVSSIILIDGKSFERKIKISERQKLKKASDAFEFKQTSAKELNKIYSFIATCRMERSQTLSMTFRELRKTISAFPDRFFLFTVGTKNELAAAAIVIKVSKQIVYTFYYAHAKKYNRISPVVFLVSRIYDFAATEKLNMIDLGTSMIEGHVNRPVLHFKKSIGGVTNKKLTFHKTL